MLKLPSATPAVEVVDGFVYVSADFGRIQKLHVGDVVHWSIEPGLGLLYAIDGFTYEVGVKVQIVADRTETHTHTHCRNRNLYPTSPPCIARMATRNVIENSAKKME